MNRTSQLTLIAILLFVLASSAGCVKQRTVLIPAGEPVQLAEPVWAYVYVVVNGAKERSGNRVLVPEGWFALPDPGD